MNPLVQRAQQGDELAWAELYTAHFPKIVCLCIRMTRKVEDAQDLAQETFLSAWKHIGQFKGESSFSTWVHKIAVNKCLMYLRSNNRYWKHEMGQDTPYDTLQAVQRDPELQIALVQAIAHLSPQDRLQIMLYCVWGYEHHEIAKVVGKPMVSSKTSCYRAKRKLREALKCKAAHA